MTITEFMSQPANFNYVCDAPTKAEKHKRIAELTERFKQSKFSSVNFSGYVEDTGNEEFSFLNDERDSYPELNAVQKVRRSFENALAVEAATLWAKSRNATAKANREKRMKNGN